MRRRGFCIVLGDGRRVSAGQYAAGWRAVCALPADHQLDRDLLGPFASTAGVVRRQYRRGLHDRINRHVPGYGRGRKWADDYQTETIRAARSLNTPRLVIDWLPPWLTARFAHRLRENRT